MTTPFDVDAFLAQPVTARVATSGPTIRPVWYLWEDHAFWVLAGPWAKLAQPINTDPGLALTVDICDLDTGLVRQVIARGQAEIRSFDVPRGQRIRTPSSSWPSEAASSQAARHPTLAYTGAATVKAWIRPMRNASPAIVPGIGACNDHVRPADPAIFAAPRGAWS